MNSLKSAFQQFLGRPFLLVLAFAPLPAIGFISSTIPDAGIVDYVLGVLAGECLAILMWGALGVLLRPMVWAFGFSMTESQKTHYPDNLWFCIKHGPLAPVRAIESVPAPKPGDKGVYFLGKQRQSKHPSNENRR